MIRRRLLALVAAIGSLNHVHTDTDLVYTLSEPAHRDPVGIDWDGASHSFYVITHNLSTIYRGHLADPNVPVYIRGKPGHAADTIRIASGRIYVTDSAIQE